MPIIEYFHLTQTYQVSIVRTVEWKSFHNSIEYPNTPYVPSIGYDVDSRLDYDVILETADETLAFQKMTELWNDWSSKNFTGVIHA